MAPSSIVAHHIRDMCLDNFLELLVGEATTGDYLSLAPFQLLLRAKEDLPHPGN